MEIAPRGLDPTRGLAGQKPKSIPVVNEIRTMRKRQGIDKVVPPGFSFFLSGQFPEQPGFLHDQIPNLNFHHQR
jgi:hypothetical protein